MTTTAPPPPIIRPIRDTVGFLRSVPRLVGCTPRNSLVVVPLAGAAMPGALRIDLPDAGSEVCTVAFDGSAAGQREAGGSAAGPAGQRDVGGPDEVGGSGGSGGQSVHGGGSGGQGAPDRALERQRSLDAAIDHVAATAVGMACRVAEVDAIAVVAYASEEQWPPDGPLPQEVLVDRVIDRADACGLQVRGAFLVAQDGWGAYGDVTAPASLADILPEAGAALAHDQHDGTGLPAVADDERAAIAAALLRREREFAARLFFRQRVLSGPPAESVDSMECPEPDDPLPPLGVLPDVFERVLCWDPSRVHPADAALLALAFETPMLRDAMLTQWSTDLAGGRECLEWQLQWRPAGTARAEDTPPGPLRLAGDGPYPEQWRMMQGLALARHVAAAAPPRAQAGALASAAWLSWALGNSTHAAHYVEAALEREPQHPFARLIEVFVVANRLPAWSFRQDGAADAANAT